LKRREERGEAEGLGGGKIVAGGVETLGEAETKGEVGRWP